MAVFQDRHQKVLKIENWKIVSFEERRFSPPALSSENELLSRAA